MLEDYVKILFYKLYIDIFFVFLNGGDFWGGCKRLLYYVLF